MRDNKLHPRSCYKFNSSGNNRSLPLKTHRGYKPWKKWFESNKNAMKNGSGRDKQKLPDKKRSA